MRHVSSSAPFFPTERSASAFSTPPSIFILLLAQNSYQKNEPRTNFLIFRAWIYRTILQFKQIKLLFNHCLRQYKLYIKIIIGVKLRGKSETQLFRNIPVNSSCKKIQKFITKLNKICNEMALNSGTKLYQSPYTSYTKSKKTWS